MHGQFLFEKQARSNVLRLLTCCPRMRIETQHVHGDDVSALSSDNAPRGIVQRRSSDCLHTWIVMLIRRVRVLNPPIRSVHGFYSAMLYRPPPPLTGVFG